jgi:1-deoxy-D-xylulose-5-phosphate reductoisomerase
MTRRGVAILGSTGSVGTTALRVLARQQEQFAVRALTAFSNAALLRTQVAAYAPSFVGIVQPCDAADSTWATGAACLVDAAGRRSATMSKPRHRRSTTEEPWRYLCLMG